jgi:hypothetical protein
MRFRRVFRQFLILLSFHFTFAQASTQAPQAIASLLSNDDAILLGTNWCAWKPAE